ncbi:MAG: thioredoxin [Coriobacteriales bacterium]|nr:thioredoxin [Coriobacteriales bacterium]
MSKELTAAMFDSAVKNAQKPVLVDFWASWCGPCRALSPIVEEIANEMSDRLDVYKCNVDEEGALAQQFGIMSIPTLILFKNGEIAHQMIGSMPKAALVSELEAHL